jgi:3-oxoacyl-[acyl-carrier-protein] synthase II
LKSIEQQLVHPTINLDYPDPACDLDYVASGTKECKISYALSNSFGFGGHNVSLMVGKLDGTP